MIAWRLTDFLSLSGWRFNNSTRLRAPGLGALRYRQTPPTVTGSAACGEVFAGHFGLFFSNIRFENSNYRRNPPTVCDGEHVNR
jgi:hypothetical protein